MMFPNGLFPRLCNPAADLSRQTASQKDKLTFSYGAHKIASAMSRTTFYRPVRDTPEAAYTSKSLVPA